MSLNKVPNQAMCLLRCLHGLFRITEGVKLFTSLAFMRDVVKRGHGSRFIIYQANSAVVIKR